MEQNRKTNIKTPLSFFVNFSFQSLSRLYMFILHLYTVNTPNYYSKRPRSVYTLYHRIHRISHFGYNCQLNHNNLNKYCLFLVHSVVLLQSYCVVLLNQELCFEVLIQANRHETRLEMKQKEVEMAWTKTETELVFMKNPKMED